MNKKVVINVSYGGFTISPEGVLWLYENRYDGGDFAHPVEEYFGSEGAVMHEGTSDEKFVLDKRSFDREHPMLIGLIEELGERANGWGCKLKIVEIPKDVEYTIEDYDGWESIHEKHRSWE